MTLWQYDTNDITTLMIGDKGGAIMGGRTTLGNRPGVTSGGSSYAKARLTAIKGKGRMNKVIVVRYRKIDEVVPTDGVSRLYHVIEDKYYEWDGSKWVKEEVDD